MQLLNHAWIHTGTQPEFFGSVLLSEGKISQVFRKEDPLLEELLQEAQANTDLLEITDLNGLHLLPGFIDIHLHGSYGHDFIRHPQESVDAVARGLPAEGTTSFLASLTVVSHEDLCSLLSKYGEVVQPENAAHFLGVHSEGPFLNHDYKALMDPLYLRDASWEEFQQMKSSAQGTLKVMTIAPERKSALDLIRREQDVRLMIGHSAATSEEARAGLEAGAAGFTHLYNAMSQHEHRNPGCVTAALLDDACYCELIADGFHVHPDIIRTTWKVLRPERLILITDAMPGKGMPDGHYVFSNLDCVKQGNTVRVKETGRIAGSAITMLDAARNMKEFCSASLDDIARMACVNPSVIAGVRSSKGSIEPGKDGDLIVLDEKMHLRSVWVEGKCLLSE